MAQKRECQSCHFFEPAGIARSGWCRHPSRMTSASVKILVRGQELSCRDEWNNSLWESALAPLEATLQRVVQGARNEPHSHEFAAPSVSRSYYLPPEFKRNTPRVVRSEFQVVPSEKLDSARALRVFLCHASGDKPLVRDLYQRLKGKGIEPWFDEENLLPGQHWQEEIPRAVRQSDVVLICLTNGSISKTGYVQKEIGFALDAAEEQPEGSIFLIPLRLEECSVPNRLRRYQRADLFAPDGFDRLMRSLVARSKSLGLLDSPENRRDS